MTRTVGDESARFSRRAARRPSSAGRSRRRRRHRRPRRRSPRSRRRRRDGPARDTMAVRPAAIRRRRRPRRRAPRCPRRTMFSSACTASPRAAAARAAAGFGGEGDWSAARFIWRRAERRLADGLAALLRPALVGERQLLQPLRQPRHRLAQPRDLLLLLVRDLVRGVSTAAGTRAPGVCAAPAPRRTGGGSISRALLALEERQTPPRRPGTT